MFGNVVYSRQEVIVMKVFENAKVILNDSVCDVCVATEGKKIIDIAERMDIPGAEKVDCKGRYLAPGFVDIHVHGGGGHETMECDPMAIKAMCEAHLKHGSTSMLPTLSAAPIATTLRAIDAARAAAEQGLTPNARGIYLEGPFMSPAQAGAQLPENLLIPAEEDYEQLLDRWEGLRMIGVAPELRGAMELGDACAKRGIVVSVAHSDATMAVVEEALEHGFSDITHIYSGCSLMTRKGGFRIPGVVEAGLILDEPTVQVICDLCHLPAELLRLIYKCCGADRISLITDALLFAGTDLKEGESYFQTNGQECIYEDGVLKMADRSGFCGSVATTDVLVRNMHSVGLPWHEVIKMASTTPASVVGLKDKGSIAVDKDADLVLFDEDVNVQAVWLEGEQAAI
ncbi:MAG: N-acetylglucosamine-6-phosphate deacetylase [Ruminococcaceae bacterium]|nr:N-acetylglucosamine-6-phosphate deacetylase [Oscillospiraceae bacterium]